MMQEVKQGYKVVAADLTSSGPTHHWVEYGKRWTQPPPTCGPLCVFHKVEQARAHLKAYEIYGVRIYSCWYVPSVQKQIWVSPTDHWPLVHLPNGTALADAVYLGERIQ